MARYAFPFVGAGQASYFEWAEVHVAFERGPTAAEQEAIAASVPLPLTDSIDFDGNFLMVASDQFAHMAMAEAYEADPGDEGLAEDSEEEYGRFFFAAGSQVRKFNEDTERWLKAADAICPILVAFRAEDSESGGTELSEWHRWSLEQSPDYLARFDRGPVEDEEHPGTFMLVRLLGVLRQAEREVPADFAEVISPGDAESAALLSGDADQLRALFEARTTRREAVVNRLLDELDDADGAQQRALLTIGLSVLKVGANGKVSTKTLKQFARLAAQVDSRDARDVMERAIECAKNNSYELQTLGFAAYEHMVAKDWEKSWRMFDAIVRVSTADLTTYNNALYAVMADNTGLGVQPERARRYVEAALPFGPRNPSIFYNVACVYMELGEIDKVFENIALALEHNYDKPQTLRDEELFEPLRDDPRFVALFE